MAGYIDYLNQQPTTSIPGMPASLAALNLSPDELASAGEPSGALSNPALPGMPASLGTLDIGVKPSVQDSVALPHPSVAQHPSDLLSSPQYIAAAKLAATPTGLTHPFVPKVKLDASGQPIFGASPDIPETTKPGFFRKLGKIAEGVGNVLGDIVAPQTMALIPGTQLNRELQAQRGREQEAQLSAADIARQKQTSESAFQDAETRKQLADVAKTEHETAMGGQWKDEPDMTYKGRPIQSNEFGQHRYTDTGEVIPLVANNATAQPVAATSSTGAALPSPTSPMASGSAGITPASGYSRVIPPKEGDTPLGTFQDQAQKILNDRWRTLNPGKNVPAEFVLPQNATRQQYDNLDKNLTSIGAEANTRAQQDFNNQIKQSTQKLEQGRQLDSALSKFKTPYTAEVTKGDSQLDKIDAAYNDLYINSAESAAIAIPKVLTALVSGAGSGVRITMPELNMLSKARGLGDDFRSAVQKMAGKSPLADAQRNQLMQILDIAKQRVLDKQTVYNTALDQMNNAPDEASIRTIDNHVRTEITNMHKYTQYGTGKDGKNYWLDDKGKAVAEKYF